MNIVYDAWSVWSRGGDEQGTPLPLHIRGFNGYSLALPYYITAPFVGLFGLNEFTARLPFALMGIATIFLTILLGRRWFSPGAGLLAGLFLAIDPWHVVFTRIGFLVAAVPLFTTLALYVFTRFVDELQPDEQVRPRTKITWAALSALCFALLTLSYAPMKLEAPLLLGACILAAWKTLQCQRRTLFVWLGLYILFISPLIYDQLAHGALIQQHFQQVSVTILPDWYILIFGNYAAQFDPSGLFFQGLNRTPDIHLPYGVGELFWLEGPLWIVVLIDFIRRPWTKLGFNLRVLLGLWLVTYPIASSLTWGPTTHREINVLSLPELVAGYGAMLVCEALLRTRVLRRAVLYAGVVSGVSLLLIFCLLFFGGYFSPPLLETNAPAELIPYNIGFRSVLQYVSEHSQSCDEVWLEPSFEAYMAYLFYTRYPPSRFQQAARDGKVEKLKAPDGFLFIPWLDNVRFAPLGTGTEPPLLCPGQHLRVWFSGKSGLMFGSDWQDKFSVNNASGAAIWRVQLRQ